MTNKMTIQFAVKANHHVDADNEILIGYIKKENKNSWAFFLTGKRAGQKKHLHKDKWILFGNLWGARAHLRKVLEDELYDLDLRADSIQCQIDSLSEVMP